MKRGLLLMVVILLSAGVAFAQYPMPGGAVGVYSDNVGSSCNFTDGGGVVFFHFYLNHSPGATALEFIADLSEFNYTAFYGDSSPFILKIGTFGTGVSLSFGSCQSGNIYLGSATYGATPGTTPPCARVYVKNNPIPSVPGATNPIAVGCPEGFVNVAGSYAIFNNDGSCACSGSVPVNETSWGQIKSLYH